MTELTARPLVDADDSGSADRGTVRDDGRPPRRRPRARPVVWLRACAPPFCTALAAGYALAVALVAVVVTLAGGPGPTVASVLGPACAVWLAAEHVPLTIGGVDLGVLPLLLLFVVGWFTAYGAGAAARRLDRPGDPGAGLTVCAVFGCANAVVGSVFALLTGVASPVLAFLGCFVVGAVAALAGVLRYSGLAAAATARLDPTVVGGIRCGLRAALALFAAAAALLAVALAAGVRTGATLFAASAPGAGSGIGMTLLCAVYLPNAVVAAGSFAAGTGFSVGALSATPVAFTPGPLPGVPLLAAVPGQVAVWWPFLLALPAAVGVFAGWSARHTSARATRRLRTVAIAALVAAATWLVLAALAGGTLGHGAFTPVVVPAGAVAVAVFGWIAVVGGITALFARPDTPALPAPRESADAFTADYEAVDLDTCGDPRTDEAPADTTPDDTATGEAADHGTAEAGTEETPTQEENDASGQATADAPSPATTEDDDSAGHESVQDEPAHHESANGGSAGGESGDGEPWDGESWAGESADDDPADPARGQERHGASAAGADDGHVVECGNFDPHAFDGEPAHEPLPAEPEWSSDTGGGKPGRRRGPRFLRGARRAARRRRGTRRGR